MESLNPWLVIGIECSPVKLGKELCMSSTYHIQTDGQTEALNRCLDMYLRCMTDEDPRNGSNTYLGQNTGTTHHIKV